ncbi:conserved protein of unknown function [Thiomonas sp. OC7]|nr:hypothetical protein THICB3100018 [Thiomonas sp. CB3]VDY14427.1 conserved protein of unknown function [Thiomonas sp. OC7]
MTSYINNNPYLTVFNKAMTFI